MRTLLLVTALCWSGFAQARCMSAAVWTWPEAGVELPARPVMLVNGFGGDQDRVARTKSASLRSGKHRVPVEIVALNKGAFQLTQLVLRASADLKPGHSYTLWLEGSKKAWSPTRWVDGKTLRVEWRASEAPAPSAVAWKAAPKAGEGSFTQLGCGDAVHRLVDMPVTARDGLVQVKLTKFYALGDTPTTYVVPLPAEGPLEIGHGMCSGPFEVGGAGQYRAELTLLDRAGQPSGDAQVVDFAAVTR